MQEKNQSNLKRRITTETTKSNNIVDDKEYESNNKQTKSIAKGTITATQSRPSSTSSYATTSFKRRRDILWRDFLFVIAGGIALRIISYVETHAADHNGNEHSNISSTGIMDAGYVLTIPIYEILKANNKLNDILAFLNTIMLIIPSIYTLYITFWDGDYSLSFRLIATQLFRSFCGWFTFLPPDPSFLMSVYDYPEIFQCMFQMDHCIEQQQSSNFLPFVSFFSGHVASTVIVANHMYARNYNKSAMGLHILNVFQIIRLLSTRGHYSIDIIIGWVVAIYVSNPADKLGLYYSRGTLWKEIMPKDHIDAFETMVGIRKKNRRRSSSTAKESLLMYETTTPTTAKIISELASEFVNNNLSDLRLEVTKMMQNNNLQFPKSEMILTMLPREDLLRLLSWAQLKVEELRAEAQMSLGIDDLKLEEMTKREILNVMWERMKIMLKREHSLFDVVENDDEREHDNDDYQFTLNDQKID